MLDADWGSAAASPHQVSTTLGMNVIHKQQQKTFAIKMSNLIKVGIDFNKIINFLKNDCKIDVGFEAQLVGVNAKSATTTGLIVYVISSLTELTTEEKIFYLDELDKFIIPSKDGFPDIYGTNHPCSWATAQVAIALIQLRAEKEKIRTILDKLIEKYQLPSGAWCFSREEDERLIYCIYPIIALLKAIDIYQLNYYKAIRKTAKYLNSYVPEFETDKVIILGLLNNINRNKRLKITNTPNYCVYYFKIAK